MAKFRPRKNRKVSEAAAEAFEAKYANGVNETNSDAPRSPDAPARVRPKKTRATFYLPVDLLEALKDAVVALRVEPDRFTMTGVVEAGLRAELKRLEKEHNDGRTFPPRQSEPHVGRPPK